MMRGTSPVSTISKPSSPIVQAMSVSPSLVRVVPNRSRSSPARSPAAAVTIAAAEPSANTDDDTIWSGELLGRMCRLHSSVQTTSTTASGWAAQNRSAARSAGNAAAHPMNPRW